MGDKRGHRDQVRHRGDEPFEQDFSSIRPSPRTYQQTGPAHDRPSIQGTVKRFDANKGFGFVSLESGGEAFIHVSRIKPLGYNELVEGSPITVRLGPGKKGPEVIEVIDVGAAPTTRFERGPRPSAAPPKMEEADAIGIVKWFNPSKGFGFVAVRDRQKDVFVSARTLQQAGINDLLEGKRVRMKVVVGQKGPEARSIEIID
jgi:CspA family cold shock protein